MDITSLVGPVFSLGTILVGMILEGGHLSSVWGPIAALIVFGGAFGALMVAYPMPDIIYAFKQLGTFLKNPSANLDQIKADIVEMATIARKESILALEKKRASIAYPPLANAVKMAVDGTDPATITSTLETAAHVVFEEAEVAVKFWEDFGAIAPTIGILGAVLGLMHVMNNLDKPEMIGPGIATAFVATLYGVGAANIFGIPVGKKLKRKAIIEGHARAMVQIGMEGIIGGLNPKVIDEKLAVFCHGGGGGGHAE